MATEEGDCNFVSTLDEKSRRKAKDELNELNEKDREIAVQTLRKWAIEANWLKSPTDFGFLLRFLRARKYSQLQARQTVENYWAMKTNVPEYFRNIDPADPILQAVFKTGFTFSPRKLDEEGRRVMFIRTGYLDVETCSDWGMDNVYKALSLVLEWITCDENVQVNGLVFVIDHTNETMAKVFHVVTPKMANRMFKYFQKSLQLRAKRIHEYNEPAFFDAILAVIIPFMTEKVKNRQIVNGRSLVKIYEDLGQEVLPREYLPDDYSGPCAGTTAEVIDEMIASMNSPEFRKYIQELTSDKYSVDLDRKKRDNATEEASFRKLNQVHHGRRLVRIYEDEGKEVLPREHLPDEYSGQCLGTICEAISDCNFVSTLDEKSRRKAKDELNELNEKDREIAVQTLRKWVIEADWLKSPTDFGFLLRFLRARKYSQLQARQTVENYWAMKTNVPEYYPADPILQAIFKTGFTFSPRKLDEEGRRVMFIRTGYLDVETCSDWGMDNVYKALSLVLEWITCDENVQVNGLVFVIDHTNETMAKVFHVVTPKMANRMFKYFQKSLPLRAKRIHEYNEPAFFDAILAVIRPFMTEKVKNRQIVNGRSLVKIYEDLGQEVLPREYLPDDYSGPCAGTTAEVIEEMIKSMNSPQFRKYIQELTSDKYSVDLDRKKRDNATEEASFRKLNVD